jgi:hypothetical protein
VTGKKLVGIDGGKKSEPEVCQFCGGTCPMLTCPRLKYIELDERGAPAAVEFFEPEIWRPQ